MRHSCVNLLFLSHKCAEFCALLKHGLLTSSSTRLLVVQCPRVQVSGVWWSKQLVSCRLTPGSCRPALNDEPQHGFGHVVCLFWQLYVEETEGSWVFSEPLRKPLGSPLLSDGHASAWEACWWGKSRTYSLRLWSNFLINIFTNITYINVLYNVLL